MSTWRCGWTCPCSYSFAAVFLAGASFAVLDDPPSIGTKPVISTSDGAPSFWQNMKREAAKPATS